MTPSSISRLVRLLPLVCVPALAQAATAADFSAWWCPSTQLVAPVCDGTHLLRSLWLLAVPMVAGLLCGLAALRRS